MCFGEASLHTSKLTSHLNIAIHVIALVIGLFKLSEPVLL